MVFIVADVFWYIIIFVQNYVTVTLVFAKIQVAFLSIKDVKKRHPNGCRSGRVS